MKFNFTDAWVLQSIFCSERTGQGAELTDIISYADYANHAILTYTEFTNSVSKLMSVGIVSQVNAYFQTSEAYVNWWITQFKDQESISILATIEAGEKFLNESFLKSEQGKVTNTISPADFQKAVDAYMARPNFSKK